METETRYASFVLIAVLAGGASGFLAASNVAQPGLGSGGNTEDVVVSYANASGTSEQPNRLNAIFNSSVESVVSISTPSSQGSGFVYSSSGHIVTNNHVVEGTESIDVRLNNGTVASAELVGGDPYSDLAVIKIPSMNLKPLTLGDSDSVYPGDTAAAIGSPFSYENTMTSGIISQTGRLLRVEQGFSIPNVIQTDASINPGNSGGPLLNSKGEVVGVNTAIAADEGRTTANGVGFAIPSNSVKRIAPELISEGDYEHAWIGISGYSVTPGIANNMGLNSSTGFLIVDVVEDGPAENKLEPSQGREVIDGVVRRVGGDVVRKVGGKPVRSISDILEYLEKQKSPGDELRLTVVRNGSSEKVKIDLEDRPETN